MTALLAEAEADGLMILGQARSGNDEIDGRTRFIALPEADIVVNEVDARGAFRDFVGANHFVKMDADFGRGVGDWHAGRGGVSFEAAPVAFVGEGFAARNAQRGEDSPAASKARLAGRKANLFDWQQALVVEDIAVDHALSSILIVSEMR